MDQDSLFSALKKGNLPVSGKQREQLLGYHELLSFWSRKHNLISRRLSGRIYEDLYYDSLVPVLEGLVPDQGRCIDIGTGAGIPGLLLAIFRPGLRVTLIDSIRKKALFLKKAIEELGLDNAEVVQERVENLHPGPEFSRGFGLAVLKGFGTVKSCLDAGLPFLSATGRIILYKGADPDEEIKEARNFFPCYFFQTVDYYRPEKKEKRTIIIINGKEDPA